MAKFLTTAGSISQTESIIINSETDIFLVSAYFALNQNYKDRLKEADEEGKNITFIHGTLEKKVFDEQKDSLDFLMSLKHSEILYCKDLHAKCFANESQILVTSLNLLRASESKNREMGVLLTKKDDEEAFIDAQREIRSIIKKSEVIKKRVKVESIKTPELPKAEKESAINHSFYLIPFYNFVQREFRALDPVREPDCVVIKNFAGVSINVEFSYRIVIDYGSIHLYNTYSHLIGINVCSKFKGMRFYSNKRKDHIYMEEGFSFLDLPENEKPMIIDRMTEIFKIIHSTLKQ